MKNKFENPQIGDPVALNRSQGDPIKVLVTRVLATQFEVEGGDRIMRSTGRVVGRSSWARPWTAEIERAIADRAEAAALEERRVRVLERLRQAARPVWWMPNPRYDPARPDNRVAPQVDRTFDHRALDRVEALAAEVERLAAEAAAELDAAVARRA